MPPHSYSGVGARRPPRACAACARRKVSCDKMRPRCSRCVRAGISCQYAFANAATADSMVMIDETPADLAEHISIPARLDRLGEMISSLGQQSDSSGNIVFPDDGLAPEEFTRTEDENQIEDSGFLYRGAKTKSRYLSKTSFLLISQEVSAISDLLRRQQRYAVHRPGSGHRHESESGSHRSLPRDNFEVGDPKPPYGDIFPHIPKWPLHDYIPDSTPFQAATLEEIVAEFPTMAQCESLIWAYMTGYHTMKPLFYGPFFLKEVRRFQRWSQGHDLDYDLSAHFISLLAAVIFAGSVVSSRPRLQEQFGGISREKLSSRFYNLAVRAIRLSDFPQSPSLQSFAAFIIIDATWLREEQPLTCCSFIGVAFRVAQMLGLHKDPSKFPDISSTEIQVRRQLWWNVVTIDTQVAFASGLPPLIESGSYDVEPVSELSDAVFTEEAAHSGSHVKSILGIFIGGKYNFYKKSGELLRLLHSNRLSKKDLDDILNITQEIREDVDIRRAQITSVEQALGNINQLRDDENAALQRTESNPILAQFTRTLLSMFAAKPFAIMYGPVQRHKLLPYLREKEPNAIMYCREYLQRFLALTQRSDFQPWHWCWPGQHQPLHSIMALISDLEEFPSGPLARETRKLVDLAFTMTGKAEDNGGIISNEAGDPDVRPLQDGGHEAWQFVRMARDRCWEKAGLDPDVFNCPPDANEINFGYTSDQPSSSDNLPANVSQDFAIGMFTMAGDDPSFMGYITDPSWDFGNVQGMSVDDQTM